MALGIGRKIKKYFDVETRKQYKREIQASTGHPVSFHNWWFATPELIPLLKDDWLSNFVSTRLHATGEKRLFQLVSVFGTREIVSFLKKNKEPIVFCTAENVFPDNIIDSTEYVDHCLDSVDLALGFADLPDPKYLRFPVWLFLFSAQSNVESVNKILRTSQQKRLQDKQAFCSMVSTHDKNGLRTKLFQALEPIDHIDSAGKLLRNTNKLQQQFQNNKQAFLENYKFNICPENSNAEGYVTEKPFDAAFAGTLPIYWGSNNNPEPDVLNKDAMLLYSDSEPLESFANRVQELYQSEKLYQEFMAQEIFMPTAAEFIVDKMDTLETRLRGLLKNS